MDCVKRNHNTIAFAKLLQQVDRSSGANHNLGGTSVQPHTSTFSTEINEYLKNQK